MKTIIKSLFFFGLFTLSLTSCEEGENELSISLKSGAVYTSEDGTITPGENVRIGIKAETEKDRDPLIKFNITQSINGGSKKSVYSKDINTTSYEYDYSFTADTLIGTSYNHIFTITNKDGFNKQVNITLNVAE